MDVLELSIGDIKPYENNPRNNADAVQAVANSIERFGFQQPIVVDKDGTIIVGHTRYEAAKRLGMKSVPVVVADNLDDGEVAAYRLADNKSGEVSTWDFDKLMVELDSIEDFDIDMADFGFSFEEPSDNGKMPNGGGHPDSAGRREVNPTDIGANEGEIDLSDFRKEKFDNECPRCGFRFNGNGGK